MVTKYLWSLTASLVIAILGAALMVWPFAVHANVGGWTRGTTIDFWSGIGLAVVGLLALAAWYGALKRELIEAGIIEVRPRQPEPATPSAPTTATPDDDLDRLLRPLAETVLRDLSAQLKAKEQGTGTGGGAS